MSLNEKLTGLADEVRDVSSISQRLSIEDMTREVSQMSSLNNFFLTKLPVMNDGKGHLSTPHGAAQRFNNQGGLTGELVHPDSTNIVVNALKGDVVTQSFVMKTDANFKNVNFNFQTSYGDQVITAGVKRLTQNIYKLYASYTVIKDTPLKLMLFWADCRGGTYVEVSQPYASII